MIPWEEGGASIESFPLEITGIWDPHVKWPLVTTVIGKLVSIERESEEGNPLDD